MNRSEAVLIGESAPMQRLRMLIGAVAPTSVPVLVEGATGTGKELVAQLLHRDSGRTGALVAFNVCALSDSMFEDALFGHTKGAFTGALHETLGYLREANGGTVFFDEISGLPLASQAKLLRAIETGVVRPIGSSRDARSDFRVVAATNEPIDELVTAGRFRADLAHRLSGIVLRVPSLEERAEDIPDLVEHFVRRSGGGRVARVTRGAMQMLRERPWPGNVRELRQVVEASLVFGRDVLDVDSLELVLAQRGRAVVDNQHSANAVERQRLLKLLMAAGWDTEAAAASLGVHRTTVYRRMRRLGIPVPSSGATRVTGDTGPSDDVPTVRRFASIGGDVQDGTASPANASA